MKTKSITKHCCHCYHLYPMITLQTVCVLPWKHKAWQGSASTMALLPCSRQTDWCLSTRTPAGMTDWTPIDRMECESDWTRKRSGCKMQSNEIERQKQTIQLLPQTKNTGGKKRTNSNERTWFAEGQKRKKNTSGLWDLCRSLHLGIWSWRTSGCRGERQERATVAVKSWKKTIWAYNNCLLSSWHQPLRLPLSVSQCSRQTVWSY